MHFHLPFVVVGNNEVRHAKPQSGPLPDFFGGEKGFEDTFAYVLRHACAIVFDLYFCPRRVQFCAQRDAPWFAGVFAQMTGLCRVFKLVQ